MIATRAPTLLRVSVLGMTILGVSAHAATGDVSFNPTPDIFDEDKAAQFDAVTLLSHVVANSIGIQLIGQQGFESGFTAQQKLNDWFSIGSNRMRVGFGSSTDAITWNSRIGAIDASSTEYGLSRPHGTYGNAPGVDAPARNYVADLQFLTYDAASQLTPPSYVVMQFETPITFLSFGMIDYGAGTGGSAEISIWQGDNLGNLTQLTNTGRNRRDLPVDTVAGDFNYFIAAAPVSGYPNPRPSFSYAILELGTQDSTIGFDNFFISTSVPEPETYALFLAGLGILGVTLRKQRA